MSRLLLAAALFVPTILLLDGPGVARQLLLGGATLAFLLTFARNAATPARNVVAAILIATAGELVLSIGWGLYSYQHALIPFYVPFGHGVFYLLAAESALHEWPRRHARAIANVVLIAGSIFAIVSLFVRGDQWGLIWWILAATLIARARNQLLLSLCVLYTTALEWVGPTLGNWTWHEVVPGIGLRCANPPSGVGLLYVVLDLLVVLTAGLMQAPSSHPAEA